MQDVNANPNTPPSSASIAKWQQALSGTPLSARSLQLQQQERPGGQASGQGQGYGRTPSPSHSYSPSFQNQYHHQQQTAPYPNQPTAAGGGFPSSNYTQPSVSPSLYQQQQTSQQHQLQQQYPQYPTSMATLASPPPLPSQHQFHPHAHLNSPGYQQFASTSSNPNSPAFGYAQYGSQPPTPYSGSYNLASASAPPTSRPPISVFTDNNRINAGMSPSFPVAMPNSASLSASALAFLATHGESGSGSSGLDPTSIVYDENSGGYATPSYAGSYADDSSFDDRPSGSPFRPAHSREHSHSHSHSHTYSRPGSTNYEREMLQQSVQQLPFRSAQELLMFREQHPRHPAEWDDASSAAEGIPGDDARSSPYNARSVNASPAQRQVDADEAGHTGNGLEMAYERMFAPLPSPKLFNMSLAASASPPPSQSQSQSQSTVRPAPRSSASPASQPIVPTLSIQQPGSGTAGVFTASPFHSPRLVAAADNTQSGPVPAIPQLARHSPSPKTAGFRHGSHDSIGSNHSQPSLKSPPLPNGIQQTESKTSSLAPLAIPDKPDLTLTTATPTAVPRTATARQDSTQAALDTVFATFFERHADRKDSTDSMPNTDLPAASQQALYNMPKSDLTLNLNSRNDQNSDNVETPTFRLNRPLRQRSKSDTYMTSPVLFEPTPGLPSFSFLRQAHEQGQNSQPSSATRNNSLGGGIDPRALDGANTPLFPQALPGQDGSALSIDNAEDDMFGQVRASQAGPSPRRRSAVDASPYGSGTINPSFTTGFGSSSNLSPSMQDFLLPPSPMRRSRSHSGAAGQHRRGAKSEDFTSSTYSPRGIEFGLASGNLDQSIPVPYPADSQQYDLYENPPHIPQTQQNFGLPPLPTPIPSLDGHSNSASPYPGQDQHGAGYPTMPEQHYIHPPSSSFGFDQPRHPSFSQGQDGYLPLQTPLPGYPTYLYPGAGPGAGPQGFNELAYPGQQLLYAPLEEDMSVSLDPMMALNRSRRRSSVNSNTSGWSASGSEITLESKTTEATKQAARRRRKDPNSAKFACEYCGETFTRAYNLKGHIRSHEGSKPFVCQTCGKGFARRHDLKRHELLHTGVKKYICQACQTPFVRLDALQRHHKSENGAACMAQIQDMADKQGMKLEEFQGFDLRGVEL